MLRQNSQLPAQVHNGPSQFGNSKKAATSPATVIGAIEGKAGEKKKEKGEIEEGEAGEGATDTGAAGEERRGNVGVTWSRRERERLGRSDLERLHPERPGRLDRERLHPERLGME